MIHLITGVPGAGKTLRAIHHIVKAQESGRLIYTNIDGINIEGLHEAPEDWTTTPEGSLVVYDEAQQIFPADGKSARSSRPDIAAMELHRHTGHDLILITQHPNLIHSHVRRLVGKHEHLKRAFGWNKANIYMKDEVMRPESKRDQETAEQTLWNHDKKLFDLYKSASLHVEHKRVPKPLIYAGVAMLLMIAIVGYFADRVLALDPTSEEFIGNQTGDIEKQEDKGLLQSSPRASRGIVYYDGTQPPQMVMSGCIASKSFCRCWDEDLNPIFMDQIACYNQMEEPIPRKLRRATTQGAEGVPARGGADEGAPPLPGTPS